MRSRRLRGVTLLVCVAWTRDVGVVCLRHWVEVRSRDFTFQSSPGSEGSQRRPRPFTGAALHPRLAWVASQPEIGNTSDTSTGADRGVSPKISRALLRRAGPPWALNSSLEDAGQVYALADHVRGARGAMSPSRLRRAAALTVVPQLGSGTLTVQDFISRFPKASVPRVMPTEFPYQRVEQALGMGNSKVRKLLTGRRLAR